MLDGKRPKRKPQSDTGISIFLFFADIEEFHIPEFHIPVKLRLGFPKSG